MKDGKCGSQENLFAYAHGMLGPRERISLATHLTACSACRAVVEDYEKLDRVLDEWKGVEASPWFDARAWQALVAAAQPAPWWRPWNRQWTRLLAPAFAAVAVLVSLAIYRAHQPPHLSLSISSSAAHRPATLSKVPAPAFSASSERVQGPTAEDELNLYRNLPVLEDYDLLANFDVLSELSTTQTGE